MKYLNGFFFYSYVGALVIFGAVGIFTAQFDQKLLFHLNTDDLAAQTSASLLSQYRFSRAIELGFGLFAGIFRREIYQQRTFNRLFLATMALGVVGRTISLFIDGRPAIGFYVFIVWELLGVLVIFRYSRTTLKPEAR